VNHVSIPVTLDCKSLKVGKSFGPYYCTRLWNLKNCFMSSWHTASPKGLRTCGIVLPIELNSPWYRLTPPL